MELKIVRPENFIQNIEFNFDELKKSLEESLEKYQNITFSHNQIKLAKNDRAMLNKLKDAIENKRKEIKQKCLNPYMEFEAKIKILIEMIDSPISEIDKQIKNFEDIAKQEKKEFIIELYNKLATEKGFINLVPFEKIFNKKWLNVSEKLNAIESEIVSIVDNIDNQLKILNNLDSKFKSAVIDKYLETLNLTFALQENRRLIEQEQQLNLFDSKKKEEEENKSLQRQSMNNENGVVVQQPESESKENQKSDSKVDQVQVVDFRVWVNKEQKMLIRDFLIKNNIKYGAVK